MEEASAVGGEADIGGAVDVEVRKLRELQPPQQPTEEGVHMNKLWNWGGSGIPTLGVEGEVQGEVGLAESWLATILESYNAHHERDV